MLLGFVGHPDIGIFFLCWIQVNPGTNFVECGRWIMMIRNRSLIPYHLILSFIVPFSDNFTTGCKVFVCKIQNSLCFSLWSLTQGLAFHRMNNFSWYLISVYFIEVRAESPERVFRHLEVCLWNFNCRRLLSAFRRSRLPSSSAESEGGGAPSHTESRTSQSSLAKGDRLPEEVTVHTHVSTSVLSQSSLPALEMGEETSLSRKRNSSEAELPWLHFSRTSAYTPPSDHSTGECCCPALTLCNYLE